METKLQKAAPVFTYKKPLIIKELRQFFLASYLDIYVFSVSTGEILHCLKSHKAEVIAIRRNPFNTKSIISCDEDGKIISWAHRGNIDDNRVFSLKRTDCITHFDVLEDGSFLIGTNIGSLYILSSLEDNGNLIITGVTGFSNKIAVNKSIICAVQQNKRNIVVVQYPIQEIKVSQKHKIQYLITCMACHPHQDTVAVGGERGVIAIYTSMLSQNPFITNYHWHHQPVADLCYNETGNELYSGGAEAVLMKWKLSFNSKKPMPRLGMPIQYITVGDEQTIITHIDNDITIYHGETDPIAKGDSYLVSTEKSPIDIFLLHSPTNLVITHGWIGYLQFYSIETNRRKFQMDITLENYIPGVNEEQPPSQLIQAAAISDDGTWIVTYDHCNVYENFEDYNLKFWSYTINSQTWKLNSYMKTAHTDKIISLTISKEQFDNYYCISCSNDLTAKIWKTNPIADDNISWSLHTVKEFRKMSPRASAFQSDMSLMAIAFETCIVIYDMEEMSSVFTLWYTEDKHNILELQFSLEDHGPLILARTSKSLIAWNFITKERVNLEINSSCMAMNPSTGIIAIFKKKEPVVYFVRVQKDILSCKLEINIKQDYRIPDGIVACKALWIPFSNSHILHFQTNLQEIYKFDANKDEMMDNTMIPIETSPVDTPFSRWASKTKTSLVENQNVNTEYVAPIKNWLNEIIQEIDVLNTDSFVGAINSLGDKLLPDL